MKEVQIHDVYEEQYEEPKVSLDEDDYQSYLCAAHYVLSRALEVRQPKWLHNEIANLLHDINDAMSWHIEH